MAIKHGDFFPAEDGSDNRSKSNRYTVTGCNRSIYLAYNGGNFQYGTDAGNLYNDYFTLRISPYADHSDYKDFTIYARISYTTNISTITEFSYEWSPIN